MAGVLPGADVLAHQVQLGGRDIQAVAAGVGDLDIVLLHPVHRQTHHRNETPDAVVLMHHQVPGGQVGVGLEPLSCGVILGCGLAPGLLAGDPGRQLPLGEDRQLQSRVFASGAEGAQGDQRLPLFRHGVAGKIQRRRDLSLPQQPLQILRPDPTSAQHQHPVARGEIVGQIGDGGLQAAAVYGQLLGRHLHHGLGLQQKTAGGQALHLAHREAAQKADQLLPVPLQPGKFPGQHAAFLRCHNILVPLPKPLLQPLGNPPALTDTHQRVFGQIVRRAGKLLIHRRHIAVAAAGDDPCLQRRRICAQGGTEAGGFVLFFIAAGGLFQNLRRLRAAPGKYLCRRQQHGPGDILRSTLGTGVKPPQGVDLIVKKVAAHRLLSLRGEHIQYAAPQSKLPGPLHLVAPGIAGVRQVPAKLRRVIALTRLQNPHRRGKHPGRNAPLTQSLGGGEDHRRCFRQHSV